jgi:hypothetical protein
VTDTTTLDIFESLKALTAEIDIDWTDRALGPWIAHHNVLVWALSVQTDQNSPIYDYYLVQIEGEAQFTSRSAWKLAAHTLDVRPTAPDLSVVELIDTSPSTTVGSSSYTTSISTTVGGSLGFFGDQPTATVSASVSFNNSTTRQISDLTIQNVSMGDMTPPLNATWRFEVADGSPMAESNCPINVEMLYRVPHGTLLSLGIGCAAYVTGGDPGDLDRGVEGILLGEPGTDPSGFKVQYDTWYDERKYAFIQLEGLQLTAPPSPKS